MSKCWYHLPRELRQRDLSKTIELWRILDLCRDPDEAVYGYFHEALSL